MIFYAVLPDYRIASFFSPDKAVVDKFRKSCMDDGAYKSEY